MVTIRRNDRHYKKTKQKKHVVIPVLFGILVFMAALIAFSVRWGLGQFANLKMDEIMFELRAPLQGTGNGMIEDYLIKSLGPAIVITFVVLLIRYLISRKGKTFIYTMVASILSACILIGSAGYFLNTVGFFSYVRSLNSKSDFIKNNYVDPSDVSVQFPEKKRNLIFIYCESMESTFSDKANGGAFDDNYIPELTKLAEENEDFSGSDTKLNGGYAMPGATWTMAGILATTAGVPLKTDVDDNSMGGESSFFPNMTTLGDILEDEGYQQTFVLGSDATFGGRRVYFKDHGNYNIEDYKYAKEKGLIPSDYKVFWGYEDEKLFQFSKDTVTKLASGDKPFNMTMLTVDTHMPEGYKCRLCKDQYDLQYKNVLACSSRQISEFVKWVQQQDFYKDTTIVITGDHPTMAKKICDNLGSDVPRRTYTCVINADNTTSLNTKRDFTTFDLFPTTLAALGAKIDGNRLGLGTNLYSDKKTLSEEYGFDKESEELEKNSAFLSSMENLDSSTSKMVNKFASFPDVKVKADSNTKEISYTLNADDINKYGEDFSMIRLHIWYYNDASVYVKKDVTAKKQSDGSWKGTLKADQFFETDSFSYQLFGRTKPGTPVFKIGKEGKYKFEKS